jgi:hypothetical protein
VTALAIVAFVGTTLAPWRLFLAQSAVAGRRELLVGSVFVVAGALAVLLLTASALGFDAVANVPRDVLLAVALLDAAVIVASLLSRGRGGGAGAELGDSANLRIADVLTFYAAYGSLVTAIAVVMLASHSPLDVLASTIQLFGLLVLSCAGVSVVLLTDGRRALGPVMLSERVRVVRRAVVAVLAMLALVLAAMADAASLGWTSVALLFGMAAFLTLAIAVGARRARGTETERPPPARDRARIALARLGRFWLIVVPASAIVAVPLVLVQLLVRAWWRP